jgi:hypothetical protein
MNLSAQDENAKTLAKLLGLDDDEAARLLDITIAVRAAPDAPSQAVRRHVLDLLKRTVGRVVEDTNGTDGTEIVIGKVASNALGPVVRVGVVPRDAGA